MVSIAPLLRPLLAALALAATSGLAVAQAVSVPTAVAGAATSAAGFQIEGTLQAVQQSTVAAQVSGNVTALLVKAGQRVKAGQLLVRIDERELQAGLAGGEAGVAQAGAALALAQQAATRTRELRAQGFVSQAALDSAESQLQAAQAALRLAQAGRTQAALARGHASVTAPFDGVVQATHVEAGDLAGPGRALLTLYAPGRLRAVVQLPASRSTAARSSQAVEITLPDGRRVAPESRTELPQTDAVSQTAEWRLDLTAGDSAGLAPGLPVQVRFAGAPLPAKGSALAVPAAAVLVRGELTAVYVADGARFVLKPVRLGSRQGGSIDVLAGLKAGERIALDAVRAGLAGAAPSTAP